MDNPAVASVLNQLLDAEQQSLVLRVAESTPFVSLAEVPAWTQIRNMAKSSQKHRAALSELILDFGGQPAPRRGDLATGNLHYLDLFSVLPRVVEAQESLDALYRRLTPQLASEPRAARLANAILARHESDLQKLRQLVPATPVVQQANTVGM